MTCSDEAIALAARVAAAADGGEILVSSAVREALGDEVAFGDGKPMESKGFRGTHDVYPVDLSA